MNKSIIKGTSCYEFAQAGNLVSVTGDGGNAWGFFGPAYKKLAPSWKLYTYWRDNPDNLTDLELIKYYISEYYNHRLSNLNLNELFKIFEEKFGNDIIILCHELPSEGLEMSKEHFCHRRVIADFIELQTGIMIPEMKITKDETISYVEQPDYKPLLKKVMQDKR